MWSRSKKCSRLMFAMHIHCFFISCHNLYGCTVKMCLLLPQGFVELSRLSVTPGRISGASVLIAIIVQASNKSSMPGKSHWSLLRWDYWRHGEQMCCICCFSGKWDVGMPLKPSVEAIILDWLCILTWAARYLDAIRYDKCVECCHGDITHCIFKNT